MSLPACSGADAAPAGSSSNNPSAGSRTTGAQSALTQNTTQTSESVYLTRRDFSALDNVFSRSQAAAAAAAAAPASGASSAAGTPRSYQAGGLMSSAAAQQSQQGASFVRQGSSVKYARGLYLAGLRGMLAEMRGVRPPGTPYGHTQQLMARLNPGQAHSKVR
jgi:hypothetical protein